MPTPIEATSALTAESLPAAVRTLFEQNNYEVEGPLEIHGAEIDLRARSLSDPFATPIYIEVTIEYVDNEKYGKDLTKISLVREQDPSARCLIISSLGFSAPVAERAKATRIQTLTYDELFRQFEQFNGYIESVCGGSEVGKALHLLNSVYEEPNFHDAIGHERATDSLTRWRDTAGGQPGWIVVIGEYGTGKTALTKVLLHRWLRDHKHNPATPLVFRIELRDFARQFDADGLLHHFLDKNELGHVPLRFVRRLLSSGRIVLLLDGYDEMAQYLHARERRACLEALAELSAGGARGILTSRPNYFTEAEELNVFEILYRSLGAVNPLIASSAQPILEREKRTDQLLKQFIERYERTLQDLTEEQTVALVSRVLADDPNGRATVLSILNRIFRSVGSGDAVSLSGKPVIITYLLEVVEGLKSAGSRREGVPTAALGEWAVYQLILDQLMLRDLARAPEMQPAERREFLRRLAIQLCKREHPVASEELLKDMIVRQFKPQLGRFTSEAKSAQVERYFADLRSSATLTRSGTEGQFGWRFSHNSLREYLVAEGLIARLLEGDVHEEAIPISDAMRAFVASMSRTEIERIAGALAAIWKRPGREVGKGMALTLAWDAVLSLTAEGEERRTSSLERICGSPPSLRGVLLERIVLSSEDSQSTLRSGDFRGATLNAIDLSGADLRDADFSECSLEGVRLNGARLGGASFRSSILMDVVVEAAQLEGADFSGVDADMISIVVEDSQGLSPRRVLAGLDALGYLMYHNARTVDVSPYYVLKNHPKFEIVEKILLKLAEQRIRQRRGLEQRGAARADVAFARDLVEHLENQGFIETHRGHVDQVAVSDIGRVELAKFTADRVIPLAVQSFLSRS